MLNNEKTITWNELDQMHEDLWLEVRATLEGLYALADTLRGRIDYEVQDGNIDPWVVQSVDGLARSINNLDIMAGEGLDKIAQARLRLIKDGE